ncbi:MAG: tetratricopeptide repeat protein [Treponema sp.]|nr:tetratricopeptide repeat protein [Treponema sp.]
MKKLCTLFVSFVLLFSVVSCTKSNKSIIRIQHIQEGIKNLRTVEDYLDAIEKYESRVNRIKSQNENVGLWYKVLGTKYLDKKLYGKALECFKKAVEFYPENQNIYYYIGVCSGYMAHASLDFEASGVKTKQIGLYKEAEKAYLEALRIEPDHKRSLYGIGFLYGNELGQPEKAVPYLERYIASEKNYRDAYILLARCYEQTFQSDLAADLYIKAEEIKTESSKPNFFQRNDKASKMFSYLEEGVSNPNTREEYIQAINQFDEKASDIQLAEVQISIWLKNVGSRYIDNKKMGEKERYSNALSYFVKALQYDPDNENLYYYTAICTGILSHLVPDDGTTEALVKRMNYLKTAEESYKIALNINPRYARSLYGISVIYDMEYGQPEMAIPYLETLLTIETKNLDAMVLLARCYQEIGEFDKAIEVYDRYELSTNLEERKKLAQERKEQIRRAKEEN